MKKRENNQWIRLVKFPSKSGGKDHVIGLHRTTGEIKCDCWPFLKKGDCEHMQHFSLRCKHGTAYFAQGLVPFELAREAWEYQCARGAAGNVAPTAEEHADLVARLDAEIAGALLAGMAEPGGAP